MRRQHQKRGHLITTGVNGHARTYIAWRNHPQVGSLIKVGTTVHVYGRCIALGARLIVGDLPYQLERRLLDALAPWRVWASGHDVTGPLPLFNAPTEWFYPDDEALDILERTMQEIA